MRPSLRTVFSRPNSRLKSLPLAALAMLLAGIPGAVRAQEDSRAPAIAAPAEQSQIRFEADQVDYAEDADTVTASGNVVLRRDEQSVRADRVTWHRASGKVTASGNVRLVDENGNQVFTENVELTDDLRTGAMQDLLLSLREGGRLAAQSGERLDDGSMLLRLATYSGCAVEDRHGCAKTPSWRITAREVVYNQEEKRVRFKGAHLELLGALRLPIPGLYLRTDGAAVSGFMIPEFRSSPSNGIEIEQGYYARLAENRDLTGTLSLFSKVPPMGRLQYRALTGKGAWQITGYATESRRIALYGQTPTSERKFRGYLFANGRYQFTPEWSVTASVRRATDRTFLRRYDISRDDRLRSMVQAERIGDRSYFSLAGWATQTMRIGDNQHAVPVALPALDWRLRLDDPVLDGKVELQANSLAIMRGDGLQQSRRAFAGARWDLQRLLRGGQEVTLTALARGDIYHSEDNLTTNTIIYRGKSGWQSRVIALAAMDIKWPLAGPLLGGAQVLTPRLQLVAAPSIRNLSVPNEDARSIDLEDSNLFALNRFPGYDRVEEGMRATYGFDWQYERPRWRVKSTLGQSFRLSREPTLLPNGTGLSSRMSDFVGRTEVRYRDFVSLVNRFRIDKDDLTVRRLEFDATVGTHRTYAQVGYVRLNRDIVAGLEDLKDREELRVAGRVAFARYWSLFGSAAVNLTDRKEDPTFGSDGFQPLRTRLGAAYEDDCLEIALTWRRAYRTTGDARKGNSFLIHFSLRNFGVR